MFTTQTCTLHLRKMSLRKSPRHHTDGPRFCFAGDLSRPREKNIYIPSPRASSPAGAPWPLTSAAPPASDQLSGAQMYSTPRRYKRRLPLITQQQSDRTRPEHHKRPSRTSQLKRKLSDLWHKVYWSCRLIDQRKWQPFQMIIMI